MTFTIVTPSTTDRPKSVAVPRKGRQYDYTFLSNLKTGAVAAIQCGDRSVDNVRRSVQYAKPGAHTMALDNVLMVW